MRPLRGFAVQGRYACSVKHVTPLRLLHGAAFIERTKEIEILLDIAGEQKFLTHGLPGPASNFLAQFLVLEQSNNAVGGFFHRRNEKTVHAILDLVTNSTDVPPNRSEGTRL